ncbi:MAG: hypothetical protein JXB10_04415 [Pirellulales bacterium]|nr:hypothetical protein [Pirellulales bacterium]
MNKLRLATFVCSAILLLPTLKPGKAGDAKEAEVKAPAGPVERMLRDFAAASSTWDFAKAERLFAQPDDTPAGEIRRRMLEKIKTDWRQAKKEKQKMSIEFRNTVVTVRSEMHVGGDEALEKPIPVEFHVRFTKDGCKIVSMKFLPLSSPQKTKGAMNP